MARQIEVTVYNAGNVAQTVAFLVDAIYVQEYIPNDVINAKIIYYGDPVTPTIPTNEYTCSETVTDIVTASGDSLVQATVWAIGASGKFKASQQFAFPSAGASIWEQDGDEDINSYLYYRGKQFFAAETQSTLVTAANAGGGGGGGDTLFGLTGSNTATGNVTGNLNGKSLAITDGANYSMLIDPPNKNNSISSVSAGGAASQLTLYSDTDNTSVYFDLSSFTPPDFFPLSIRGDSIAGTITLTATNGVSGVFIPPTSDPHVAGAIWNNSNTLAISAG